MFTRFLSLDQEKQERILNAALQEFAQNGYDKASTNKIVQKAGISKGLLFHYFKNKKELFLYLYDYVVDIFAKDFFKKIDFDQQDIIMKLRQVSLIKMELIQRYPEIFNFLLTATVENSNEVKDELENKNNKIIASSYEKLFKDFDLSKFKDGLDIPKSINIIMWSIEGFQNQVLKQIKNSQLSEIHYEQYFAEFDVYTEMLKNLFYQ